MKALIVGLIGLCCLVSNIAPGNDQGFAQVKPANARETFKMLRLDGNLVRWPRPSGGRILEITYRVLTAAEDFPGSRNCRRMRGLGDPLAASGVTNSVLESELAAAFAMWEAVANLTFRLADIGEPANILIGAQAEPEGWAFADVFYDAAATQPIKPITLALICLNPARPWKVGFDGNLKAYDLRYTFAHEIGHAIGLDHPSESGQIMSYRYEERFRDLQPGDVIGALVLYGPAPGSMRPSSLSRR